MAKQRSHPALKILLAILLPGGIIAAILYFLLKKKVPDKGTVSSGVAVLGSGTSHPADLTQLATQAAQQLATGQPVDLTRLAQEAFKQVSQAAATAAAKPAAPKPTQPTTFVDDAKAFLGGLVNAGKDLPVVGPIVSGLDALGQLPGVKQIGDFIGDLINPDIKTTQEQLIAATTPGTAEYIKFQADMEAARVVRLAEMQREEAAKALLYAANPSTLESQIVQVAPGGKIAIVSNSVAVGDIPGTGSLSLGSQTTASRYLKPPILT